MQKIDFKNFPDTSTPLSAENLNLLQTYIENAISESWKVIYPVGSIYISVNPNSPETLFGGRWEKLKDTFLLSQGDTYTTIGATGGAATVALEKTHLPAHTHDKGTMRITGGLTYVMFDDGASTGQSGALKWGSKGRNRTWRGEDQTPGGNIGISFDTNYGGWSGSTSSVGDGTAHNNMPPYTVVYMWKRLADTA